MNSGKHPWKGNLTVETEIPSLKDLLKKMETIRNRSKNSNGKNKRNNEKAI